MTYFLLEERYIYFLFINSPFQALAEKNNLSKSKRKLSKTIRVSSK